MARPRSGQPAASARSSGKDTGRSRAARRPAPAEAKAPAPAAAAPTDGGAQLSIDAGMVKGLARSASRIVSQAATILEEELSAGIGAAKQIESRLLNVAEMRSTNPNEVMARFRKDAHEVVDIVLDLINVPTRSLSGLAQRITVGGEPAAASASSPTIAVEGEVSAGASATVPFSLENDGDTATAEFAFQATDLVNAEGETILARHVKFEPASLTIPPHGRESVLIRIAVPKTASPGTYSGLVLASKLDRLRAVLVVSVE